MNTCKDCNKRPINPSRSKRCCDVCLDKRISSQNKYYETHWEQEVARSSVLGKKRKQKLKAGGLCIVCGKNKAIGTLCIDCSNSRKPYVKDYRTNNKKKIQERQKLSIAKKPEVYKAIKKKFYENNKEDWYKWVRERIARKRNAEGSYTHKEWIDCLNKYGNKCLQCGSTDKLEADHVVPLSKGGTNYINNIQPLCSTCNKKKSTKILDFRPFGSAILEWT